MLFTHRQVMVIATAFVAACSFDGGDEPEYPSPAVRAPFRAAMDEQACPGEDDDTRAARLAIARVRAMAGLPALRCDTAASEAARGHCHYLVVNDELSHFQTMGRPAFTAVSFEARLAQRSFVDAPASEVIASFSGAPAIEGPRGFLDSVYHRAPFLRWETVSFGYGHEARCVTIDFGKALDDEPPPDRLVVWPPDGATSVPRSFHAAAEVPNPVPGRSVVGYPVSLFGAPSTHVLSVEMTDARGPVDAIVVTATNDPAHLVRAGEAYLIPKSPLARNGDYRVRFVLGTERGSSVVETRFTTGLE